MTRIHAPWIEGSGLCGVGEAAVHLHDHEPLPPVHLSRRRLVACLGESPPRTSACSSRLCRVRWEGYEAGITEIGTGTRG